MSTDNYRGIYLPAGSQKVGPFHPAVSDMIFNIAGVHADPGQRHELSGQLAGRMLMRLPYVLSSEPFDQKVARNWLRDLRPAVMAVANQETDSHSRLVTAWTAYAKLQSQFAGRLMNTNVQESKGTHELADSDSSRDAYVTALRTSANWHLETTRDPGLILFANQPPSAVWSVTTEWTQEFHVAARERCPALAV